MSMIAPGFRVATLLLLGIVPALSAQEPPPQVAVSNLMQMLRDRRLGKSGRAVVVKRLLENGERGALALHTFARVDYRTRHKNYRKSLGRHLRGFAIGAQKVFRARQNKRATKQIDELRQDARMLSRQRGLTKQLIHEKIDPICAELEKLLVLSVEQVLEARSKVGESDVALRAELNRVLECWSILKRAEKALEETPDGKKHLARQKPSQDPSGYSAELSGEREWLAILARPMSKRDMKTLLRNRELSKQLEAEEYDGILVLNLLRLRLGRSLFAIDVKLCNAARGHSDDMRRLKFFSHTSRVPGKESFGKRAALAGTSAGAENIARGASTGRGSIRQWWYSPGHHRNMMRGGGRVGLGRSQGYWTQMFGG